MRKTLLILLVMISAHGSPLIAQSKNGTVLGTVRATDKFPIPGAQITLSSAAATYKVRSNERGEYQVDVPPGSYMISAELRGFKSVIVTDVSVKENESKTIDPITLAIDKEKIQGGKPIPLAPLTNQPSRQL